MKKNLLTKEIEGVFPPLYANEEKNPDKVKIIVKYFNPYGAGVWYATEYDPSERLFFGFAEIFPDCGELGYFSLDELESVELTPGLPMIEHDKYFGEHTLKEILDGGRP